jgi:NAD(P)-dependent dehydrogenase (short-subunit alcohol dehydrogenase family)
VVCVTGSSRNIGVQTASAFAHAGATGLILTARTEASLRRTVDECKTVAKDPSIKISVFAGDLSSTDAAEKLAALIKNEHERLDVLVNNAGSMGSKESAFAKLADVDVDQIEIPIRLNVIGRMAVTKYCLPLLLGTSNGLKAVVNITSLASHFTSGTPVAFNMSELATNRFTESLAEQYADDGLVAYAVHPGTVKSDFPPGFPEVFEAMCRDDPGLCGAFLVWLVKEKRAWLSGRYVHVNWDVTELEAKREEIEREDKLKVRMVV